MESIERPNRVNLLSAVVAGVSVIDARVGKGLSGFSEFMVSIGVVGVSVSPMFLMFSWRISSALCGVSPMLGSVPRNPALPRMVALIVGSITCAPFLAMLESVENPIPKVVVVSCP